MSLMQNKWFRRFGLGAVAALSLGIATLPASQAQAHEYGYRASLTHRVAYFPRYFFGFGGGHHWHHADHWSHRWH